MRLRPRHLYKYRAGAAQDFESLRRAYIWTASLATLNDPFEAQVSVGSDIVFPPFLDFHLAMLRHSGICSFSQTALDARSWAYYAAGYEGYCVEYDTERLLQSMAHRPTLLQVQYSDAPPSVDLFESMRLLLANESDAYAQVIVGTKARGWSHEQEWRLITPFPGAQAHDPAAVTRVYVGYRMRPAARRALQRRLRGRVVAIEEVRPSSRGYDLEAVPL